jgi:hypothetical protein
MARFDEEWVIELLTHARNMIIAAKDWVIRNLDNISGKPGMGPGRRPHKERYLTAVFMVVMAIRKPAIPTSKDIAMWPKRSPAWSECLRCHVNNTYTDWI